MCDASGDARPLRDCPPSDTVMTHRQPLVVHRSPRRLPALFVLLPLLGCGHTEPFDTPPTGTEQPFDVGPPARLTLNGGPDRGAAWLPDGSGIVYSAQQLGRRDNDVCLAVIPPGGGRQRQLTCNLTPTGGDSADAIESPAPAPDGRLAFVGVGSRIGAITPGSAAISLGSVISPTVRTRLQALPYSIPGGPVHRTASQLHWLTSNRLLYLGERADYHLRCAICVEWDTVITGLDAVSLDVGQPGSTPQRIPGTESASGVSVGANEDEIYYTRNADPRVYRQTLSTGAVSLAYDFGSAGSARDVHVVGSRMAVVVGGRVAYGLDPSFGLTQWDSGGTLHVVDLQSGSDVTLEGPGLFRRPRISPSGSAIVAEVYPLIITEVIVPGLPDAQDTTVSRSGDLYLYGQP
jgi:hypothetical protein